MNVTLSDFRTKQESVAPIFCEGNRAFWVVVRRVVIELLRMIDAAYGFDTFRK